ncbi:MAG: zf-HC2 domain-containing protein [bacterium]|nr:zf-HC2 domain-containing protein [bacterium]
MNCSSIDLKGYLLGELAGQDSREVDKHAASCAACADELDRLRVTQTALLSVRDEEMPRRIAFVSDKVFEPSWWQRFWQNGPRMGFAAAAMLAVAIVVHAFVQPPPVVEAPGLDQAAVEAIVANEVAQRLDQAVAVAVAASEKRQATETARLLAAAEERFQMGREADLLAAKSSFEALVKRYNVMTVASAAWGAER